MKLGISLEIPTQYAQTRIFARDFTQIDWNLNILLCIFFHSSALPLPSLPLLYMASSSSASTTGCRTPIRSLKLQVTSAKEPRIMGLSCGIFFFNLWPMEIRHSVGFRHPVVQGIVTVCSSSLLGGFYSPASPTSAMTPLRCGFPRVERKGLTTFAWRTVTKRESSFFWIFWNSEYRQRFPLNILKLGSSPEISLKSTGIWRSRKYWFCVLKFPWSPLHSTRGTPLRCIHCLYSSAERWGAGVEYHFQEISWALRPVVNGT